MANNKLSSTLSRTFFRSLYGGIRREARSLVSQLGTSEANLESLMRTNGRRLASQLMQPIKIALCPPSELSDGEVSRINKFGELPTTIYKKKNFLDEHTIKNILLHLINLRHRANETQSKEDQNEFTGTRDLLLSLLKDYIGWRASAFIDPKKRTRESIEAINEELKRDPYRIIFKSSAKEVLALLAKEEDSGIAENLKNLIGIEYMVGNPKEAKLYTDQQASQLQKRFMGIGIKGIYADTVKRLSCFNDFSKKATRENVEAKDTRFTASSEVLAELIEQVINMEIDCEKASIIIKKLYELNRQAKYQLKQQMMDWRNQYWGN